MKVIIQVEALADLENIYHWIAQDSPATARAIADRILAAIEGILPLFPFIGRVGRKSTTRELVVSGLPYIVIYEVDPDRDVILVRAIFHGARQR